MPKSIVVFVLILAAACGTQTAQRTTAERLTGQVSRMQTDLGSMAESRRNIAVARDHVMERLLHSALDTELANADRLQDMAPDQRQRFDSAVSRAEAAKVRMAEADNEMAAAEAIAQAETSRIDTHAEDFAATTKLLGRLSEKEDWREQLTFYFHFFNEVKDSLDKMGEETKKNQVKAEAQIATQAPAPTTTTSGN